MVLLLQYLIFLPKYLEGEIIFPIFAGVNETRSSSGEPLSLEVLLTLLQEP